MKTLVQFIALSALTLLPNISALAKNQVIINFGDQKFHSWQVVNDGVMGGLSKGSLHITPSGIAVFQGRISLENRGGFTLVRWPIEKLDLSSLTGIVIRIRGDGQQYRFRLRTDNEFDGISYQAKFRASSQAWVTIKLPFSAFIPTYRGRILEDKKSLDLSKIHQVGFMIADKQAGDFQLEIESIKAY